MATVKDATRKLIQDHAKVRTAPLTQEQIRQALGWPLITAQRKHDNGRR